MNPADLPRYLPILIPMIVIAVVMLRAHKPQRITPGRLWLAPALVTLAIGVGLWFQPHPPFAIIHYAVMALGAGLGVAAGTARAKTLRLSREPGSGAVLAQASPLALLLLVGLVAARMAIRPAAGVATATAVWPAAIIDASMLFALAMVVSQRLVLWQRINALPA